MKTIICLSGIICLMSIQAIVLAQTPQTVIDSSAVWKYWADTQPPNSNNWKGGRAFDDSAWPAGQAPLGYSPGGADKETTTIPTGCGTNVYNCAGKYPTIYFRKTFTVSNVNDFQKFIIRYRRDDGIVIYVNGAEVKREFMPDGVITRTTSPTASVADETVWQTIDPETSGGFVFNRIFLHTGTNVIAAEVHQSGSDPLTNSTDLRFQFELKGVPTTTTPQLRIVRGPYLQMGTPTSITIRWSTQTLSKGQVRYDTVVANLTAGNTQANVATETGLTSDHQIRLTNLLPNKRYYYVIESAGLPVVQLEGSATTTSTWFFQTAPLPGTAKKTRIWALGDFGTNNTRQDSVITSFRSFLQQRSIGYIDMWLWMGDNAYDWGLDEQYQANVFDKTLARYDWIFRQTPFYATPGNHDYQTNFAAGGLRYDPHPIHYYDVVNNFTEASDGGGGEPSHREEYYSFNYNNIHIVSLDSYGFESGQGTTIFGANGPQVSWLKQDLAKAQADPTINWIIAYWHHPPYTRGSYNSDTEAELVNIRNNFLPILEQYKIDMVITGHSHVYERSRLMKGLYGPSAAAPNDTFRISVHNPFLAGNAQSSGRYDGTPNSCFYFKNSSSAVNEGIVYVVNGAGGRSGGIQSFGRWPSPIMQSSMNEGGSLYLEIDGKRLDAKFVAASGTVKDQFTIIKDNDGFAVPPTNGTSYSAVCECTDTKGFTHYADQSGNLLLSIKKNGNAIGTVGVGSFDLKVRGNAGVTRIAANSPTNYVRLASYRYRNAVEPWILFNRYWTLTPGTELSGNKQVVIRQYYTEADMTAMNAPFLDDPMTQGNLNPFKVNDDVTTTYNLNPTTGGHASIPQALAYNRPGAWVYEYPESGPHWPYPTTLWWLRGDMGKGRYSAEYVAGRLKGGGGIGAPTNFASNPSGQKEQMLGIWNYLVGNTAPPSDWKSYVYFDVSGWGRGYPPFGYSPPSGGEELTVIPNGCSSPNELNTSCPNKTITTYFRAFAVIDYLEQPFFQSYILNYRRDDGVIIYINGQEVLPRDPNMPAPPAVITATTSASLNGNKSEWRTVILPKSALQEGFNVIAAEVHQASADSPDLHFSMELIGTPDLAATPIGLRTAAPASEETNSLVVLYPNPVEKGKVFFSPALSYETLQLTDLQGKTYRYISQPGTIHELDVSSLPAGVYILTSYGTDTVTRYKIVKQ